MDLVLFSDTHELHRETDVPDGDILICAGDFTMMSESLEKIVDFNLWLGDLPHKHKLVVPGNHEFFLANHLERRSLLFNGTVLVNETVTIDGLVIYGSPVTPFYGGAFGMPSSVERRRHWRNIPEDTKLLVTHGPPYGVLDQSPGQSERLGDPELTSRISELKELRLHCFGHVHGAFGVTIRSGVTFSNVSLMGHLGELSNEPVRMRLKAV